MRTICLCQRFSLLIFVTVLCACAAPLAAGTTTAVPATATLPTATTAAVPAAVSVIPADARPVPFQSVAQGETPFLLRTDPCPAVVVASQRDAIDQAFAPLADAADQQQDFTLLQQLPVWDTIDYTTSVAVVALLGSRTVTGGFTITIRNVFTNTTGDHLYVVADRYEPPPESPSSPAFSDAYHLITIPKARLHGPHIQVSLVDNVTQQVIAETTYTVE